MPTIIPTRHPDYEYHDDLESEADMKEGFVDYDDALRMVYEAADTYLDRWALDSDLARKIKGKCPRL